VNSLSAHLLAGPEHGRLRFHPDCPVCRNQRLVGSLSDGVLPARAQAGLLAAALGAGTLFPAAGAAASPAAEKPAAAEASQAPALGDEQVGVDETQEAPVDEAPELRELLTNPDLGTDSGGEDIGAEDAPADPAPPEPLVAPPVEPAPIAPRPAPAPVAAPAPPQPAPAPVEPPPAAELEATPPEAPTTTTGRRASKRSAKARQRARQLVTTADPAPQPVSPAPVIEAPAPSATVQTVPISQPAPPANGPVTGRSYTVQPCDSLWSIARRLLGAEATNGQIAREVNWLWQLNQARIGTGDPSLIHVGTQLRLR
jgi:hypothetical protein